MVTVSVGAVLVAAISNVGPASAAPSKALASVKALAAATPGFPAVDPPGPQVTLVPVATGQQPIGVVVRPGDTALYVQEKIGRIRAIVDGQWREPAVLDIREIVSTQNERGLIGVAFSRTHLYVSYTAPDGAYVLSEFAMDGPVANAKSERQLLKIPHPNDDHYGGSLAFDAAGLLYVSVGDGGGVGTKGGVGDKANNAQNLTVFLGKVLRIDPRPDGDRPYGIPASNPFAKVSALSGVRALPEIFAYGVRNPYRISIQDEILWIPDVGQSSWEEINRIPISMAGGNFGWRLREGKSSYKGGLKPKGAIDPVFVFAHTKGRCAVIGGASVGSAVPALNGSFVFADLCTGRLLELRPSGSKWSPFDLGDRLPYVTSIGTGPDGQLYATSYNGGIYRLTFT